MRFPVRISLLALVIAAVCALLAPASWGAEFGIKRFEAGTCTSSSCTEGTPELFYRQAAGHPPFGITDIEFNTEEPIPGVLKVPVGKVKTIRVDIPPGLAVNPLAVPRCTEEQLEMNACSPLSKLGVDEVTTVEPVHFKNVTIPAVVYDIEPGPGHPGVPSLFGFNVAPGAAPPTYLVGGVSWHPEPEFGEFAPLQFPTGDFHEFFTISDIPEEFPFIETRLITEGKAYEPLTGTGPFVTMPSTCNEHPNPTSSALVESWKEEKAEKSFETPVGATGCNEVPFNPAVKVEPATTQSDQPDAAAVKVEVPQNANPEEINSSTLQDAQVTLPEGMTLNPSAVNGLEVCTDAQFPKGTGNAVTCPAGSQIGTVTIETPDLPAGSLTGKVYVGAPLKNGAGAAESGEQYRIFIDAEAPALGVAVRLEGRVTASATTGRLTTMVVEDPPLPFSDFIVTLNGPHVPLANPLTCGAATSNAILTPYTAPYTGKPPATPSSSFVVDSDGKGGACAKPLPFSPSQATQIQPNTAGAYSSYTLSLTRQDGQQYLSQVKTTLPRGLLAAIPSVPLCGEPQAALGTCASSSAIGTATVAVGAGSNPFTLSGTVYLTGPYAGAPYGLSIVVPADKVGPYSYGLVVTRARIDVDKYTGRVIVTAAPPTIVGGVPLRLRTVTIAVNRNAYLFNPTNCSALSTDSALSGFTPGTSESALAALSTPFQVTGCSALAFKPTFASSTDVRTSSKTNGISLVTTITQPAHEANIASVFVSLPKILPSRLTTLQQACLAATFEANPASCPAGSLVGSVTVSTPVLPTKLTGPAYLVSHGNAAFPDLDLILRGSGVEVILVGTTNIVNGITTTNFASLPDVPISSVEVNLPVGPHSALQAEGNVCAGKLVMPTKITAQSGAVINQNTTIQVKGCAAARHAHLRILGYRVRGHRVTLTIRAPSAGRLSAAGKHLRGAHRRLKHAGKIRLTLRLTRAGVRALHRHHHITIRIRVSLSPAHGRRESAHVRVRFPPRHKHARRRR